MPIARWPILIEPCGSPRMPRAATITAALSCARGDARRADADQARAVNLDADYAALISR